MFNKKIDLYFVFTQALWTRNCLDFNYTDFENVGQRVLNFHIFLYAHIYA